MAVVLSIPSFRSRESVKSYGEGVQMAILFKGLELREYFLGIPCITHVAISVLLAKIQLESAIRTRSMNYELLHVRF